MATFDVSTVNGERILWLDSSRLQDCMAFCAEQKIDHLAISPARGYGLPTLDVVGACTDIRRLTIVSPPSYNFDFRPLLSMSNLNALVVSSKINIPLTSFPQLREFRGLWDKRLLLEHCSNIEILDLSGYKHEDNCLKGFPCLPLLKNLCLSQSSLRSLSGVERLSLLERIELSYFKNLESISGVERLESLEFFSCQKCGKLKNHSIIGESRSVRILRFNSCGEIQSLSFVVKMRCLEEIRFVGTNVVDGEMRYLIGLKQVGFDSKKHYTHSPDQVKSSSVDGGTM